MDEQPKTLQLSPVPDNNHHKRVILYGIGALLLLIIGTGIGFTIATNSQVSTTTMLNQKQSSSIQPKVNQHQQELNSTQAARIQPLVDTTNWRTYDFGDTYTIKYPPTWIVPVEDGRNETSGRSIYLDTNHSLSTSACGGVLTSYLKQNLVGDIGAGETPQAMITLSGYPTWYAYSKTDGLNGRYKAVYLFNYKGTTASGTYSIKIDVNDTNKNSQLSVLNAMLQSFKMTKDDCPKGW